MEKFKVKKKHTVGELEGFPKHIVQLMVEEQVNQGNVANPRIFTQNIHAGKSNGGFNWKDAELGHDLWAGVINRKQFHRIPKPEKPKGHVHAKLMKQYAKDSMTNERPWELWEMRVEGEPWKPMFVNPKWSTITEYRRKPEAIAVPTPVAPHEIIKAMLDNGMTVLAAVSDDSYDDARARITHGIHRVTEVEDGDYPIQTILMRWRFTHGIHRVTEVEDGDYPIQTILMRWRFAVPVNTDTMTEITELP